MSEQLGNILYFLLWAGVFFSMRRFGCGARTSWGMAITTVERKPTITVATAICAGLRRNKLSTPFAAPATK